MTTTPVPNAGPAAPPKSCIGCPSYLSSTASVGRFKKSVGAPMCGRYGIVLGRPGATAGQANKIAQHYGSKCASHGQPMPAAPEEIRFTVALPDMAARDRVIDQFKQQQCTTCAQCVNFVGEQHVMDELGWTAGMCAAKGKLIRSTEQTYEARNCTYREWGAIRRTTGAMSLFPEYEDAFNFGVDPVKAWFKNKSDRVEPQDYVSDKEVSDEEAESGIRAWRRVADPTGSGNETFLPIYRLDYFDDVEQAKIPKAGDDERPELYVDHFGGVYLCAVAWTELDETPALWGEAGTGKTELFRHLAYLMGLPFERVSITAQTELDDLAGKMKFTPERGTYFQYGRLPLAWAKPCVIVIDEPTVGPSEVWQFIRPLTDNSKQLILDMNEGERIKRHEDCYMGMAMNPSWDPKNVGALEIGDADANRLFHLYMDLPPEELEREIIRNRVALDGWEMDDDRLNFVMAVAKDLRALATDDTLPITWGVRPQIKVARALRWFDPITAYRRAVADYLEPAAQEILLNAVRAHTENK